MTNFMDAHLLHQLLCFPILLFQGLQFQQKVAQPKFDRRILMCMHWIHHVTILLQGGKVTRLPTAAAIVSTRSQSSHELRSAQVDEQPGDLVLTSRGNLVLDWTSPFDNVCRSASALGTSVCQQIILFELHGFIKKLGAPKCQGLKEIRGIPFQTHAIFSAANIVQPSSCPHGHHSSALPWHSTFRCKSLTLRFQVQLRFLPMHANACQCTIYGHPLLMEVIMGKSSWNRKSSIVTFDYQRLMRNGQKLP